VHGGGLRANLEAIEKELAGALAVMGDGGLDLFLLLLDVHVEDKASAPRFLVDSHDGLDGNVANAVSDEPPHLV
jgi:hypothetical protein